MPFDDLAADGQADSRSLVLGAAVKALENRENLLGVDLVKADPVIFDQDLTIGTGRCALRLGGALGQMMTVDA